MEQALDCGLAAGKFLRQARDQFLFELGDRPVVLDLALDAHRLAERGVGLRLDVRGELGVALYLGLWELLTAGFLGERVDHLDQLLDRLVRRLEGLDGLVFGDFAGACLHHHDAVSRAGHHEIELAQLALREGRVDDVLALDEADAHGGHGLLNRHLRQGQRGAGAGQRQHVRVVFGVGRQHERDDLRFVRPARGEQRTNRPVDDAAGQRFLFGGLAFTLEEAARNAARCVGVFAIVDREGQKVDALAGAGRVAGRNEDHRVAHADDYGAIGLLREAAGLDGQGLRAER